MFAAGLRRADWLWDRDGVHMGKTNYVWSIVDGEVTNARCTDSFSWSERIWLVICLAKHLHSPVLLGPCLRVLLNGKRAVIVHLLVHAFGCEAARGQGVEDWVDDEGRHNRDRIRYGRKAEITKK